MAKQKVQEPRTIDDRIEWYTGRLNSPFCNDKEKAHAAKRLASLTAQRNSQLSSCANCGASLPATPQQNNAYNAGIGYGAAKVGARVPVKDENKPAFRNGVQAGRALSKK